MLENKAFSSDSGGATRGATQAQHGCASVALPVQPHSATAQHAQHAQQAQQAQQTTDKEGCICSCSLHCSLSEAEREQVQQIDREESLRDEHHPPVFFTVKFVQSNLGSDSGICRLIGEWPSMDLAREQALAGLRTNTFRRLAYICDHKGMVLEILDRSQAEGREQG